MRTYEMELSRADVREAVEDWLNAKILKRRSTVTEVKASGNTLGGGGGYTVSVKEEEDEGGAET